jgi:probable rRNA maturation factor
MQTLNYWYRLKNKPTNTLSFPYEAIPGLPDDQNSELMGEMVFCPFVIEQEAIQQSKTKNAHWMHMFFHSFLHLLGYDHIEPDDAEVMEKLEIELLNYFNISNPYEMQ